MRGGIIYTGQEINIGGNGIRTQTRENIYSEKNSYTKKRKYYCKDTSYLFEVVNQKSQSC